MLGGRSADILGRRRVFVAGTALFAVSSLACALSDARGLLVGARALQGVGRAVLSPATLSIITSSLPEGGERNRGLAAWGAVGGLGASCGALLGGALTTAFGWPAIFAVNVPVGAVVVALAPHAIPADRPRGAGMGRGFDIGGALLVTGGLALVTYGIVRTTALGWGAGGVVAPLAGGVALLGAFVFSEARLTADPLVPLSIFRNAQLRAANLVVLLMYFALFSMFFFDTLYLQQVLGDDALQAGLAFLPMTLSVFTGSSLAARVVARFGVRVAAVAGMLLATAGLALFTGLHPGDGYVTGVLPGAVLSGLGMGLGLVSSTIADAGRARFAERAGVRAAQHGAAVRRGAGAGGAEHGGRGGVICGSGRRAGADRRVRRGVPRRRGVTLAAAVVAALLLRARPRPAVVAVAVAGAPPPAAEASEWLAA